MKRLYFPDDPTAVGEWHLCGDGVSFGWVMEGRPPREDGSFRAVWEPGTVPGLLEWKLQGGDSPPERLQECPELAAVLANLPHTATQAEFCQALEACGFANGRTLSP